MFLPLLFFIGLGPQSGGYSGPPEIFGAEARIDQAPAGGCRANNVRSNYHRLV